MVLSADDEQKNSIDVDPHVDGFSLFLNESEWEKNCHFH